MWKNYNCQQFNFNNDPNKLVKIIDNILSNKTVYLTISLAIYALQMGISVSSKVTGGVIEVYKLFYNGDDKKFYDNFLDILNSSLKIAESSLINIVRVNKKIKKINPNSNLITDILSINFNNDFENFEKECERIFNKEMIDYNAEQFLTLWLVFSEFLIENVKNRTIQMATTTKLLNSEIYSIDSKGNAVINPDSYFYSQNQDKFLKEYKECKKTAGIKFLGAFNGKYFNNVNNITINLINDKRTFDSISNTKDYPEDNDAPVDLIVNLIKSLSKIGDKLYILSGKEEIILDAIKKYILMQKVNKSASSSSIKFELREQLKRTKEYRTNKNNERELEIDDRLAEEIYGIIDSDYSNGINAIVPKDFNEVSSWCKNIYSRMTYNEFIMVRLEELANSTGYGVFYTETVEGKKELKNRQAAQILTFAGITALYPMLKFAINSLPKALSALLFNSGTETNLLDNMLGFIAGIILGPKYLSEEQSGESFNKIVSDFIEIEKDKPDPFISKFMEEHEFIKKEETDKFNIFITTKDYAELQQEALEQFKRANSQKALITGGIKMTRKNMKIPYDELVKKYEHIKQVFNIKPTAAYIVKDGEIVEKNNKSELLVEESEVLVEVDEDSIKKRLYGILGKNAKIINETIYAEDEEKKRDEKFALMSGLIVGSSVENDLGKDIKDNIFKLLCYLSSNSFAITQTRIQLVNLFLGTSYIIHKMNDKMLKIYKAWSERTKKTKLEDFAKDMRETKKEDLISRLF
jgi:Skp family chaperone for outer membrane proteins